MKASHTFNLLDARKAISVTERQRYILRVRTMARAVAQAYYDSRETLGFPMLNEPEGAGMSGAARDFLVEVGTEELPPLALPELEAAFAEGIRKASRRSQRCRTAKSARSPRRAAWPCWCATLAVHAAGAVHQAERPAGQRGLRQGRPARPRRAQVRGEMRRRGGRAQARHRRQGRVPVLRGQQGRSATPPACWPASCSARSMQLPIPKRMRWGASGAEFVRPVHWLVLLYGSELIPARCSTPMRARTPAAIVSWRRRSCALAQPAEYEADAA